MTEIQQGWLASVKLISIVVFATFYWFGGRHIDRLGGGAKYVRRFIGGAFLAGTVLVFAHVHGTLSTIAYGALGSVPAALTAGYGGHSLKEKIRRRSIYGALLGLSGFPLAMSTGGDVWWLLGLQFVQAVTANVVLGVTNPVPAAEEEALAATASTMYLPFMV